MNKDIIIDKIEKIVKTAHSVPEKQKIKISESAIHFACPYCGDSHTDTHKKRGTLYLDNWHFVCYNEGCQSTLSKMCHDFGVSLTLEEEYELLTYKLEHTDTQISSETPSFLDDSFLYTIPEFLGNLKGETQFFNIEENDFWDQYLKKRNIKRNNEIYGGIFRKKKSILIFNLLGDKILSFQIRTIEGKKGYYFYPFSKIYACKLADISTDTVYLYDMLSKYFGFFRTNFNKVITICEGYFDSLFFKNSMALVGVNTPVDKFIKGGASIRWVFDNDPKNGKYEGAGQKRALRMIKKGQSVFLWRKLLKDYNLPSTIKDINDLAIYDKNLIKMLPNYFSKDQYDLLYI